MKNYQDTETGQVYAFDDGVDPLTLNNRNIPTTLSENVIPKPSESHIWYNGAWAKDTEVPKGYVQPESSVPSYNPAWVSFLRPYTTVIQSEEEKLIISIDQVNSGSYGSDKLSKVVATLPLSEGEAHALISYDGAIAVQRNVTCSTTDKAVDSLNRILCAILLGGIHTEVIYQQDLSCGSLNQKKDIFVYNPSLHSRLRHQWASLEERIILTHPRVLQVSDLINAHKFGDSVIGAITNFSPFFLLHGYSAMVTQNRTDALASLWVVVEQLTSYLWDNRFLGNSDFHPAQDINGRKKALKDNRTWTTSVKHELLWQKGVFSEKCLLFLMSARKQRNKLVHAGTAPEFVVIRNLWIGLSEMFEAASGLNQAGMQQLVPFEPQDLGYQKNSNFDEWNALSDSFE